MCNRPFNPALKLIVAALASCECLIHCTVEKMPLAGGSSDTEVSVNAIAGAVVDSNGKPIVNALVNIQPLSSDDSGHPMPRPAGAPTMHLAYTDIHGAFKVDSIDSGAYTVEVNSGDSIAVVRTVSMHPADTCIHLPLDTLKPTITITGMVAADGAGAVRIECYGMNRHVTMDSTGKFKVRIPSEARQIRVGVQGQSNNNTVDLPHFPPGTVQDVGVIDASGPTMQMPLCGDSTCDVSALQLFLNDCGLGGLPMDSVAAFRGGRIVALNLSHRGLKILPPELGRLSGLESLDVHGNQLSEPPRILEFCFGLKRLRLDSNNLQFLTDRFGALRNVTDLNIANNELSSLPISITNLKPAALNITNNRLMGLTGAVAQWADEYNPGWRSTQRTPTKNIGPPRFGNSKNGP